MSSAAVERRQARQARSASAQQPAAQERASAARERVAAARSSAAAAAAEASPGPRREAVEEEPVAPNPFSVLPGFDSGTNVAAAAASKVGYGAGFSPSLSSYAPQQPLSSTCDLDVTVLSFAQWVSEMKSRQHNSSHQMQAEMSIIRNAIAANNADLSDFKRHSTTIQQQMQSEIMEIRESLSNVFCEITGAVRNNAGIDQDIKLKIQSLNEQAVRNETAFAQLADAADQSQSKLKKAVEEMQHVSERMREDLSSLGRATETMETSLKDRSENLSVDVDQLSHDLRAQMDRRKEHLKKMVNDVCGVSSTLTSWMSDFTEQKRSNGEVQNKIQSALYTLESASGAASAAAASAASARARSPCGAGTMVPCGMSAPRPSYAASFAPPVTQCYMTMPPQQRISAVSYR